MILMNLFLTLISNFGYCFSASSRTILLDKNSEFEFKWYQSTTLLQENRTNFLKFSLKPDSRLVIWTNFSESPVEYFTATIKVSPNANFSIRIQGMTSEWTFPHPCNNDYTVLSNSNYISCPVYSNDVFKAHVNDSYLQDNEQFLWWDSFRGVQFEFHGNTEVEITDVHLVGWNDLSDACNCFPPGVNDTSHPCDSSGSCVCRDGFYQPRCTFNLISAPPVYPTHGPKSHAILGLPNSPALAGNFSVVIGSTNCSILTDDSTICSLTTTKAVYCRAQLENEKMNTPLPVKICWTKQCQLLDGFFFTSKDNPTFTSISSNETFVSGGLEVKIYGTNLDSLANPPLYVQRISNEMHLSNVFFSSCKNAKNSSRKICRTNSLGTELTCYSPAVDNPYSIYRFFYLLMHPVPFRKEVSVKDDPRIPNMDSETQYFEEIKYYNLLNGKFLNGCKDKDYTVTIGGSYARSLSILTNHLSFQAPTSRPNKTSSDSNGASAVEVSVGNIIVRVGYIQYDPPFNLFVAIIPGVLGGLIFAALLALIVYMKIKEKGCFKAHSKTPAPPKVSLVDKLGEPLKSQIKRCLVSRENLVIKEEIGKGHFGKVYYGIYKEEEVAIKTLSESDATFDDKKGFLEEAVMMMDFNHPNVLTLIAIVIDNNIPQVILPYMEKGDLRSFLIKYYEAPSSEILIKLVRGVAEGMLYLASKSFIHRDLAARNCMVNSSMNVKVADFGLAKDIYNQFYYRSEHSNKPLPFYWMPVECFNGKLEFSEKTDVWSFGILMWEVYTKGATPYNNIGFHGVKELLRSGERLEKPPFATDSLYAIMKKCWEEEPFNRPTFKDLNTSLSDMNLIFDSKVNRGLYLNPSKDNSSQYLTPSYANNT